MSAVITGLGQCFHIEDAPCKVSSLMCLHCIDINKCIGCT